MYEKICVAVDGSDSAFDAVKNAAKLATRVNAGLVIMHVVRNMKVPTQLKRFVKEKSLEDIRREALESAGKEIINHAIGLAEYEGVSGCEEAILQGDPAAAIVQGAKDHKCDLIVVGTRGLGQVEGMLIGSISRKITSISNISVLVVK